MSTKTNRILHAATAGINGQITQSGTQTQGAYLEMMLELLPGFKGYPAHRHPRAEERFVVLEGTLDVCLNGQWQQVIPGQTVTVPAGIAHSLKNAGSAPVRMIHVHQPAQGYERFLRRAQILMEGGKLSWPPRKLGSLIRLSMLLAEHEDDLQLDKPPHGFVRVFAFIGSLLGYMIPDD